MNFSSRRLKDEW